MGALATAFLEGDPRRAPHAIWDSRVSTSLVFRLDEILAERVTRRVFGCAGRTPTGAGPPKTRAASRSASYATS